MTDPRIEAAARALYENIVGLNWPDDADDETKADYYLDAQLAVEAADAAAWRTTAALPAAGDIVFIVSSAETEAKRVVALWDYDRKVWHNPDLGMFYSPTYFTIWQPLPAPPKDEVQG